MSKGDHLLKKAVKEKISSQSAGAKHIVGNYLRHRE